MVIRILKDGQSRELQSKQAPPKATAATIRVLNRQENAQASVQVKPLTAPAPALTAPAAPLTAPPQEVEALRIEQGQLYREKCKTANQLVAIAETGTHAQAKALVDAIMAIKAKYNRNAAALRHYDQTGKLPEVEQPQKTDLSELQKHELLRELQNTRANISKARNMVKKYQHNPGKLVKYQTKQAQLIAEAEEIEKRLSN